MFEHSIKVPRLYKLAAKVAKQVKEEGASLKDKIYQRNHSVSIVTQCFVFK